MFELNKWRWRWSQCEPRVIRWIWYLMSKRVYLATVHVQKDAVVVEQRPALRSKGCVLIAHVAYGGLLLYGSSYSELCADDGRILWNATSACLRLTTAVIPTVCGLLLLLCQFLASLSSAEILLFVRLRRRVPLFRSLSRPAGQQTVVRSASVAENARRMLQKWFLPRDAMHCIVCLCTFTKWCFIKTAKRVIVQTKKHGLMDGSMVFSCQRSW